MLTSLLDRGHVLARAHSVRIAVIGILVSLFAAIDPVSLQSAWQSLPPNVIALIPDRFQQWIGSALFFLVILARGMPQPAVAERLSLLGGATPAWLRAVQTPINRAITGIVVHCSATREGQYVDAAEIRRWHLAKKWTDIGYHFVIRLDGTVEVGRPLRTAGAHVEGHNRTTVGICYVGGVASDGKTAKDTRTPAQKAALLDVLKALKAQYPAAKICGHRDFSPDLNRNGRVDQNEWIKACPSFDARGEYIFL